MRAKRRAAPLINPAPPGPAGGQYRPLTAAQVEQIYRASLRMLAEIGLGDAPPALLERALARGAQQNDRGRLCYPQALVEDIIAGACKTFVLHGRDPQHSFEAGGGRVYFGTGGAAVQTLDLDSQRYRPSTLGDLADFTRLADTLTNVAWFTRCCVATDVADVFALDVNTAYCLMQYTQKPVGTSFTLGAHVDPIVDLFDAVAGGTGRFAERPFLQGARQPDHLAAALRRRRLRGDAGVYPPRRADQRHHRRDVGGRPRRRRWPACWRRRSPKRLRRWSWSTCSRPATR